MPLETKLLEPNDPPLRTQLVWEREKFCQEAEFASHLVRAWGITAVSDGETSSGDQKHRIITPEELVQRAVETTQLAFSAYRDKGWITTMAAIDELTSNSCKTGF